jgi:GxxExxY protein
MELLYKEEVFSIVGAAIEVHRELGPGFLEAVYQEALEIELTERRIPFEQQKRLSVEYKGRFLQRGYCADLIMYEKIIGELKALDSAERNRRSTNPQLSKSNSNESGVLINFGSHGTLEWKRFIR